MWTTIIGTVAGLFQSYLSNQQRKTELKQAIHNKQLGEINQGNISAAKLDLLSIQARGWKDDFLLVVMITPLVLCFVSELAGHIRQDFEALTASVPE